MINETAAKTTFKKALESFSPDLLTWNNAFAQRSGLPDLFFAYQGKTVAVEVKFVRQTPQRKTSKVLTHEVSPSQVKFLTRYQKAGNPGVVLIGFEDTFVYTFDIKNNYTLEEVLTLPRIDTQENSSRWDVSGFIRDINQSGVRHD